MKKNQYLSLGALVAFTALAPQLSAAEAEVEVKTDINRPKAEADLDIKRDRSADVQVRRDADVLNDRDDRDKVKKINKATGLLGMEVRNANNDKLGEIKDLVVDLNTGKISYAVLAVGGFLGIGEKLLALPPSSLKASDDNAFITLNADRAKIEAAPGFAATAWPSMRNPDVDKFWSDTALGAPAAGEIDRDRSSLKRDKDLDVEVKGDVDVNGKKKIYTDADADKKVRIDIDKD